jgi:hypothetical protein
MDVSNASYYITNKQNANKGGQIGHIKKIFKKTNKQLGYARFDLVWLG